MILKLNHKLLVQALRGVLINSSLPESPCLPASSKQATGSHTIEQGAGLWRPGPQVLGLSDRMLAAETYEPNAVLPSPWTEGWAE